MGQRIMIKFEKKISLVVCFLSFMVVFFVGDRTNASSPPKKLEDLRVNLLPESQRSVLVHQESELFLWMDMAFKQIKQEYQKAIIEINDIVENNQPEEKMGFWRIIKTIDFDEIIVFCSKGPVVTPQVAIKTSYYIDPLSDEIKSVLEYRLRYKNGEVAKFTGSNKDILVFFKGKLEGYGFGLNENRGYEAQFNEKEEFVRAIIRKPRKPQEEKTPEYELYFPNKNDLDILKNKLIHRLKKASLVARTKEIKKHGKVNNKSVKTTGYDIDFDGEEKIARFVRKSTGDEIVFHENGKVKSFSVKLTQDKDFLAEWDVEGKLVHKE